jgi:cysteine desulfurase
MITCATEHEAVLETCGRIQWLWGGQVDRLPVDRAGRLAPDVLARRLTPARPTLVAVMLANNETGTIQPIDELAATAHAFGAFFFCDLTQAVGKIPVDVRASGIDLAAFSAHKLYGPKGVGALFVRGGEPKIELEPLITGGGQERGLRAGTLNVPGIVGFGEACRIAAAEMAEDSVRVERLRDRLEQALLVGLPDTWVNGDTAHRLPNTTSIGFGGLDARILIRDMHDVAVSTRSACSSGSAGPSHVLTSMGLTDDEAYASIRFSLGRFTTEADIDYAISRVLSSAQKLRSHGASVYATAAGHHP